MSSKSKSIKPIKNNLFINKEDLRDYIHSIHDDLRNSGAGYGQTGLKIFSVFYGLKLIKPNLNKLKLSDEQKKTLDWDELVRRSKLNDEIIEYIDKHVLDVLWELKEQYKNKKDRNAELGHFIFHQIPRDLRDKVWKDLIMKIDKIPVGYDTEGEVNLSGKVWEYFVGRDKTAISELGAFFTDRPITDFCFEKVKPKLKSDKSVPTMIDIFGGSGGFTLGYANYMKNLFPNIDWKNNVDNIYHFDMEESVVNMTGLEMFAITGYFPKREDKHNFWRQNSFKEEIEGHNKISNYDYVFSNPPYGGDKNKKNAEDIKRDKIIAYLKNLKDDITDKLKEQLDKLQKEKKQEDAKKKQENTVNLKTCSKRIQHFAKKYDIDNANDKEACSLILLMDLLDDDGTCCGVLKEGVFFDGKYSKLRQTLLENYNVTNIISIPSDAFENTTTKTSIIIFKNDGNTKKIEFSELIVHNIEKDEFKVNDFGEIELIKIKDEFDNIEEKKVCVASMKDIENNLTKEKCLYSLNMKDYKDYKVVCPEGYELKNIRDISKFDGKSKRLANFANENGKYRYYSSGQKILKCDVADFKNELSIIIGHSGDGCIFIDDTFSTLITNHVLQTDNKYKTLYIYDYLNYFWNKFYEKCYKGSTVKNTSNDEIEKFEIPFPKNMDKHKKQLDNLYKIHQEIMTGTEQIPQSERDICELIKKATDEGKKGVDYEEYKLEDIVDFIMGKNKLSDISNDGIYNYYRSSSENPFGKSNKYCFDYDDDYILFIWSGGNSKQKISDSHGLGKCYLVNGKNAANKAVYMLRPKNNVNILYIKYYLDILKHKIQETANYSTGLGNVDMKNLRTQEIKMLFDKIIKKKLQEKFDEVDKLKEDLEKNKQLYQEKMKEFFKDFEDATLKSSKDDFLPQKKSIAFCSEKDESDNSDNSSDFDNSGKSSESEEEKEEVKPKKKVKPIKKVESSSESESDNNSDSSESEEDTKPKKILKPVKKIELSDEKPKKKVKPIKKAESSSSESDSSSESSSEDDANLKSSKEDFLPQKKSSTFSSEKPKRK